MTSTPPQSTPKFDRHLARSETKSSASPQAFVSRDREPTTSKKLASTISQWAQTHRRKLSALTLALLSGYAVTAFGVAPVLDTAMDAQLMLSLPHGRLVEDVVVPDLSRQVEALADVELDLWRSAVIRPADVAAIVLRRLGVQDPQAEEFLSTDPVARGLLSLRSTKSVQVRVGGSGELVEMVVRAAAPQGGESRKFSRLVVKSVETGAQRHWDSRIEVADLQQQVRLGSGTIRSSLFLATDEAQIPDGVATQLAEIFSADIDFHRELRKGDTFSVVYETLTADGEPIPWGASEGSGRVLSAEFINGGKVNQAMWFAHAGKGGYYTFDGKSKYRSFLASPMAFSRVTSGFAMRLHPIMRTWRAHLGVDYAAPTGTPVRSVGDGVVDFSGTMNGYGNVVRIRHDGNKSTLYAHLSRIDVRKGESIEQGQRVGAVGATGWATGPHLHFEFLVGGKHQDPLLLARQSQPTSIDAAHQKRFAVLAVEARAQTKLAHGLSTLRSE